ncbi:MAG: aminopeptidase P family protein [Rhodobacteraceae bacterium]|nr:aminopeptidase P family protein [Paracoccaceae bacterium]
MSKEFFTQAEFDNRHQKVRTAMETAGIDLLLVVAPQNINYLIGTPAKGYQTFAMLFFPLRPGPLTVISRLPEKPMLEAESLADDVRGFGEPADEDWMTVVKQIMTDRTYAGLRTGLEVPDYYLHASDYQRLQSLLGEALVMNATDLVGSIKLIKSPAEIAYIRQSAAILDKAMATCRSSLAAGRTEREVSADVHHTLLAQGSDIPSSPMNFLSGPRSAFAHGEPTDRVLETGDFMHIQFGAHVRRYCCTIGRQLCLGEPTERMREVYQLVRDAGDAAIGEMRAGVHATVPHEAAKSVIVEAGMERYRLHMTGYAVGVAFPPSWIDPLIMDSSSTQTLEAGMVVAVEPPLFGLEEGLGVRLIDNVLVTETGFEHLSETTRDLIVV